jgi:hypothetical protein
MSLSTKRALCGRSHAAINLRSFDPVRTVSFMAAATRLLTVPCAALCAALGGCGTAPERASLPAPPIASAIAPASASTAPSPVPSATASSLPAAPLPARVVAHRRDAVGPVVSLAPPNTFAAKCAVMGSGEVRCWGELIAAKGKPFVLAPTAKTLPEPPDVTLASGGWMLVNREGKARCPWGCESDHRLEMSDIVQLTEHCALTAAGAMSCQYEPYAAKFRRPAIRIAQSEVHLCAVIEDGTVECFGSNGYGQVAPRADATQENADRPSAKTDDVVVVPGVTEAIDVAAGREHTCALRKDGTVLCWGSGYQGNLGDGTRGKAGGPVPVKGLDDAVAIVAAPYGWSTCAIRRNGALTCWGATADWLDWNALAAGPVEVPGAKDVVAVMVDRSLCYATKRGEVRCAGVFVDTADHKEVFYGKKAKDFRVVLPASE